MSKNDLICPRFDTLSRDLVELVPFKPTTATTEEISKSGLTCFKASEVSKMKVAENTAERVSDSIRDDNVKLMRCSV
jgi:hypothetical protein